MESNCGTYLQQIIYSCKIHLFIFENILDDLISFYLQTQQEKLNCNQAIRAIPTDFVDGAGRALCQQNWS